MTVEVPSDMKKMKRERVGYEDGEPMLVEELSEEAEGPFSNGRIIRSYYREIEQRINEEKDELANANSKNFMAIISEVENMHQHVTKPREQVADAEALLGLASTLATSVKIHSSEGITPAEFMSSVLRNFGQKKTVMGTSPDTSNILWHQIGSFVSPLFKNGSGCTTMIGPMRNELKPRKVRARTTRRSRSNFGIARPEELETMTEPVSDTDRNLAVMFEILKREKKAERKVVLENLILNKKCFAQTIENLFALSFLVKDGRVRVEVDENGSQCVVPRNGPSVEEIKSGAAKHKHFMFRLDFDDWKLMKSHVGEGEVLMPHRNPYTNICSSQSKAVPVYDAVFSIPEAIPLDSQLLYARPVKKFSRNYGRVVQSSGVTNDDEVTILNWNCKRKRSII